MAGSPLRFSIITPSYQQGQYIRQNIESVLSQRWPNFEHIVIDGGSRDQTVAVLREYPHLKWVSEKDEGQADALNKGLRKATGDIVGWINSDDYYFPGAFEKVAEVFGDPSIQWVIGDIALHLEEGDELVPMRSPDISWHALERDPDIVRQQGTFFRREFLEQAGGWNKEFYMVMDFDLWVRLAKRSRPYMLHEQLAVFRIQKNQKSGLGNLHRQAREITQVLRREGADAVSIVRLQAKKEWQWIKGTLRCELVKRGFLDERFLSRPLHGWKGVGK